MGAYVVRADWTTNTTELVWKAEVDSSTVTLTSPRLSGADEGRSEGILEAFGTRYLPNAYAYYQETRAAAKEREQILSENFPDGKTSDTTGGTLFEKVSKACSSAIAKYFRRRDELCHYYLLHKAGMITDEELTALDERKISVMLPRISLDGFPCLSKTHSGMSESENTFAEKYLPLLYSCHQRILSLYNDALLEYESIRNECTMIDAVRGDGILAPLRCRLVEIESHLTNDVSIVRNNKLLHSVGEVTSQSLAEIDDTIAKSLSEFIARLPIETYMNEWEHNDATDANWTIKANWLAYAYELKEKRSHEAYKSGQSFPYAEWEAFIQSVEDDVVRKVSISDAVDIELMPAQGGLWFGRRELSQAEWSAVMNSNPSKFKERALENMSASDCRRFLVQLNGRVSRKSGLEFRLPTDNEWRKACQAGSSKMLKIAGGREGRWGDGFIGVFLYWDFHGEHYTNGGTPNAWGLFDTLGNVSEVAKKSSLSDELVSMGGWRWNRDAEISAIPESPWDGNPDEHVGMRLCATEISGQ